MVGPTVGAPHTGVLRFHSSPQVTPQSSSRPSRYSGYIHAHLHATSVRGITHDYANLAIPTISPTPSRTHLSCSRFAACGDDVCLLSHLQERCGGHEPSPGVAQMGGPRAAVVPAPVKMAPQRQVGAERDRACYVPGLARSRPVQCTGRLDLLEGGMLDSHRRVPILREARPAIDVRHELQRRLRAQRPQGSLAVFIQPPGYLLSVTRFLRQSRKL